MFGPIGGFAAPNVGCEKYTDCDSLVACNMYGAFLNAQSGLTTDFNSATATAISALPQCRNFADEFAKDISDTIDNVKIEISWAKVKGLIKNDDSGSGNTYNKTDNGLATNNIERKMCFVKDTRDNKRFVPPTAAAERVYWWVGDSRFTGMYINGVIGKKSNEAVVAFAGRGHKWLTSEPAPTGLSLLKSCLRDGDVVVLGLGANDIGEYDSYISTYRQLMSEYPNVTFRVLSVNPVCDTKTKYLKNSHIETFNAKLKSAFANNFLDTYSTLKSRVNAGNTDGEGLHYVGDGIEKTVYDAVMSSVGG